MKSTGVIRRIDELGRIVIPKEIRKNLNIREGETLEIEINNNQIILEKHSEMINIDKLINQIVSIFGGLSSDIIIITDREKIISSSLENLKFNIILGFNEYFENRQIVTNNYKELVHIGNDEISGYFNINPIIEMSNVIGLIIIVSKTKQDYSYLLKFIEKLIINKVDIN